MNMPLARHVGSDQAKSRADPAATGNDLRFEGGRDAARHRVCPVGMLRQWVAGKHGH
jgi:hypothetical protein